MVSGLKVIPLSFYPHSSNATKTTKVDRILPGTAAEVLEEIYGSTWPPAGQNVVTVQEQPALAQCSIKHK